MPILLQLAPLSRENLFFEVRGFQKYTQNDAKTDSKKTSQKNIQKIDFGIHFGFPKAPKIAPKSTRIVSKADLGRGQLRDGMHLASNPPQVNRARRLETVSLAIHMIRSGLSVSLSLCWSATRRPNHQTQSFNPECFMHPYPSKMLQASSPNSSKILLNPSKIYPKSLQNRFKIAPKIDLKSRKRPKRDFFNFLLIFGTPGASQNRAKITIRRQETQKKRCKKKW